jgi:hypothetical protein
MDGYITFAASSVSQALDLTNVLDITFDTNLSCAPFGCGWHSFLEATFYVDGTMLWSSQTMGTELGHVVDTSSLTGVHTLEFRLEAIANGAAGGTSSHFSFDNIVAIPEPSTAQMLGGGIVGLALLFRRTPTRPDRRTPRLHAAVDA